MLWTQLRRFARKRHLTASVNKGRFEGLSFKHDWANLVKMYDLRMYYVWNSPNERQALTYTTELEHLHNELNYMNVRSMAKRLMVLTFLFYGFYAFWQPGMVNWEDSCEPKHELNLYNELDEGGDEGDDD